MLPESPFSGLLRKRKRLHTYANRLMQPSAFWSPPTHLCYLRLAVSNSLDVDSLKEERWVSVLGFKVSICHCRYNRVVQLVMGEACGRSCSHPNRPGHREPTWKLDGCHLQKPAPVGPFLAMRPWLLKIPKSPKIAPWPRKQDFKIWAC